MKMRGIRLAALGIAALCCACGIEEMENGRRPSADDGWKNPSFGIDTTENAKKVCYVTGLDYPKDYEWRSDCETGTVKCSLIVFADGVPAMKIAVGNEYNVSPDPDMHRVIKGHLYTDFSTDEETVIKQDGKEIFRYPGREMLLGMAVVEGSVYTLGQPRRGEGFTYRKDGEAVLERKSGYAFPRLQNEDDSLFFAFCEQIEAAGETIERYYQVVNGKVSQIAVREDVKKVWDAIRHKNQTCYLADMVGISSPVIVSGSGMKAMDLTSGMKPVTCRLIPAGESIGVESIFSNNGMYWASGLWKDGDRYKIFSSGMTVSGICTADDGICCILNSGEPSGGGTIFRCGESFTAPQGYVAMGNNPIAMMDGILNIGLSSVTGGKPMIWKDGITHELDLNGFICTLSVQ